MKTKSAARGMGLLEAMAMPGFVLSEQIASFSVCTACGIVDAYEDSTRVGRVCPHCNSEVHGGAGYFPLGVYCLADLIQQHYLAKTRPLSEGDEPTASATVSSRLAILVFFCSLGEVLLDHFLAQKMNSMSLPTGVRNCLRADNRTSRAKREKLFPSLTGLSWRCAVRSLPSEGSLDFGKVAEFMKSAYCRRNKLLHLGVSDAVPKGVPEECLSYVFPLVRMFVALHNRFNAVGNPEEPTIPVRRADAEVAQIAAQGPRRARQDRRHENGE